MRFSYLRLLHVAESCAFAPFLCDWIATPAIRVWRNRLGTEHWEWVGGKPISPGELAALRRRYPLASYVREDGRSTENSSSSRGS